MPGKRWGIQYAYSSSSSFGQLLNFFCEVTLCGKGKCLELGMCQKKAFFFFSCGGDKENEILFVKSKNSKEFFFFLFLLYSCYRIMGERFGKRRKTESFLLLLLVGNQGAFVAVDFIP